MSYIPYAKRNMLEIVDEWGKCYLDYQFLRLFLGIIQNCNREAIFMEYQTKIEQEEIKKTRDKFKSKQSNKPIEGASELIVSPASSPSPSPDLDSNFTFLGIVPENHSKKQEIMAQQRKEFHEIANIVNTTFLEFYQKQIELYSEFVQTKYEEIQYNFYNSKKYYFSGITKNSKEMQDEFRVYLQFLYVESRFLFSMVRTNTQAETILLEKHKLFSYDKFPTPQPFHSKSITVDKYSLLSREIQNFYIETNQKQINLSRTRIAKISKQVQYNKDAEYILIGLLTGILIATVVVLIIILDQTGQKLEKDPFFNLQFALWRGTSTIIFYMWMLGVNFLFYQKYKISHRIILENDYINYPKSNDLFKIASTFSVVFTILFVLYSLSVIDLILPDYQGIVWFPLGIWGLFVLFFINPFPIYAEGRIYCFRMICGVGKSVVWESCFLVEFACVQLFSMITTFQDGVYTICFYASWGDFQYPKAEPCKSISSISKFALTMILYCVRTWHCIRGFYQKPTSPFYYDRNILNTLKQLLAIITAILSFITNIKNPKILPAWIVFATISTIFSYIWDWRMSMDLFKPKSKNFMLRDHIIFPKINYYFWIVMAFVLEVCWTLYISPAIANQLLGSPQLFAMAFAYLQILRRGIWNIVKVQLEQVRNREVFRAIPKQKEITEAKIREYLEINSEFDATQTIMLGESAITVKKLDQDKLKKVIEKSKLLSEEQMNFRTQALAYQKQVNQKIKQLCRNVYE